MSDIQHEQESRYSVHYGGRELPFLWIPSLNRAARKALIHVHPSGQVEVQTPADTPLTEAKQALLKRARWVVGHLDEIHERHRHIMSRHYVSGETFFYLGRRHTLKLIPSDSERHVKLLRGQIRVTAPDLSPQRVKADLRIWYRQRAKEVFQRRLTHVEERLHWLKTRPDWRLLEMKTQWGSCSPRGDVLLNPHLVKAPSECIDYVILHELCHLEEHNHSPRFYELMAYTMPHWEVVKHRLDGMSELLLNE